MNKIEIVLGASVFLFSILSILFFNFGVVPSREYPGHYNYSDLAYHARRLLFLISLIGFVALGHAMYKGRLLELGLSIIVLFWGLWAWLWTMIEIYDGSKVYIKSFPTSITKTWLQMIPGIFLGIALLLDGMRVRNHLQRQQD